MSRKKFKVEPIEFEVEIGSETHLYRLCHMTGRLRNDFTQYLQQFMTVDIVDGQVVAKPTENQGEQDGYRVLHGLVQRNKKGPEAVPEWEDVDPEELMILPCEVLDWLLAEANRMNGLSKEGNEAAKKLQETPSE